MLETENLYPSDSKLIKEFENESQLTKTESPSLEVISAPPPREALVSC